MACRHVREGEVRVARQHEIVLMLRANGYPVELADNILKAFEELLQEHKAHLKRLAVTESSNLPDGILP
ncbi:MAG: hypothetical protein ABWY00_10955 [Dongiaceae bacterium]